MIPDLGVGGAREKRVGFGVPLRPGSAEQPTPPCPAAPGRQGGGAVSLRAFRLLGADGQAGQGPLSFVWLCTKEGASWGGGGCSRWEGGALAFLLLMQCHCPWGGGSSLGMMPLLSGYCSTYSPPPLQCLGHPSHAVSHLLGRSFITPGPGDYPCQLQGIILPSLLLPPEQNLHLALSHRL